MDSNSFFNIKKKFKICDNMEKHIPKTIIGLYNYLKYIKTDNCFNINLRPILTKTLYSANYEIDNEVNSILDKYNNIVKHNKNNSFFLYKTDNCIKYKTDDELKYICTAFIGKYNTNYILEFYFVFLQNNYSANKNNFINRGNDILLLSTFAFNKFYILNTIIHIEDIIKNKNFNKKNIKKIKKKITTSDKLNEPIAINICKNKTTQANFNKIKTNNDFLHFISNHSYHDLLKKDKQISSKI